MTAELTRVLGAPTESESTPSAPIAPEWQAWVAENLLAGVAHAELVSALIAEGEPPTQARQLVDTLASALLCASSARERRLQAVLALLGGLKPQTIDRMKTIDGQTFYQSYVAQNQPVIFTDFTEGFAVRDWTPQSFVSAVGEVQIEVSTERSGSKGNYLGPDKDRRMKPASMSVRDYVARLTEVDASDDIYMVAVNKNMNRPEFNVLAADAPWRPDYVNLTRKAGALSLWFGPKGTVTSFHHDTTSILFHQIYGRKRFVLASPLEAELLHQADGFFSRLDPDTPDFPRSIRTHEVILAPGETLFLPVGYWHKVTSLDLSISLGQLNLHGNNAFERYRPGFEHAIADSSTATTSDRSGGEE
jgi:Cupin-like domain